MRALTESGRTIVLVAGLTLACACAPEPAPIGLTIGVHDVALKVPEGWLHLDHGREHRFHRDLAQISLADFGPVTREGLVREIHLAHELFRGNQLEDARAQLAKLHLRPAFPSERQWRAFTESWHVARDGGLERNVEPWEVETAYTEVLARVEVLPAAALSEVVERALPDLDHGAQRDLAQQRPVVIDGREGLRIETWDRLSHDHRKSYLFVLNEGNLLVARMELGNFDGMQSAFDALVDSLEIHPRPAREP